MGRAAEEKPSIQRMPQEDRLAIPGADTDARRCGGRGRGQPFADGGRCWKTPSDEEDAVETPAPRLHPQDSTGRPSISAPTVEAHNRRGMRVDSKLPPWLAQEPGMLPRGRVKDVRWNSSATALPL